MSANPRRADVDLRSDADGVASALEQSAHELERMIAALEQAQRELDAAEAALRSGPGEGRAAMLDGICSLLAELDRPALVVDDRGEVLARTGPDGVARGLDLAVLAGQALASAPQPVPAPGAQAVAVSDRPPLVVVLLHPEPRAAPR